MIALSDPARAFIILAALYLAARLLWPLFERAVDWNAERRTRKFNRKK